MKKILKFYNDLEAHLLVCSLIFTVILIFMQVILRYVFGSSLSWSEELARYIFIWQIWLGTSVAQREQVHVRIEVFGGSKHEVLKKAVRICSDIIWMVFCLILVKYGFELVISIHRRGILSTAMRIPMYLVYLSLPFSQAVVALRVAGELVRELGIFKINKGSTAGEEGRTL